MLNLKAPQSVGETEGSRAQSAPTSTSGGAAWAEPYLTPPA